jgi:antitoxin MazE
MIHFVETFGGNRMNTQIGRWGNSLAVRIPGTYAKDLNLKEGMELDVSLVEGGLLLRTRQNYTLEELVAGITPENLHGETDWGEAVGGES